MYPFCNYIQVSGKIYWFCCSEIRPEITLQYFAGFQIQIGGFQTGFVLLASLAVQHTHTTAHGQLLLKFLRLEQI